MCLEGQLPTLQQLIQLVSSPTHAPSKSARQSAIIHPPWGDATKMLKGEQSLYAFVALYISCSHCLSLPLSLSLFLSPIGSYIALFRGLRRSSRRVLLTVWRRCLLTGLLACLTNFRCISCFMRRMGRWFFAGRNWLFGSKGKNTRLVKKKILTEAVH